MNKTTASDFIQDPAITRLLMHRYGDGGIYLPRDAAPRAAMARAVRAGFVSVDGFITVKGRRLLARTAT